MAPVGAETGWILGEQGKAEQNENNLGAMASGAHYTFNNDHVTSPKCLQPFLRVF